MERPLARAGRGQGAQPRAPGRGQAAPRADLWAGRAAEFRTEVGRRWAQPDSSRDFVLSHVSAESTVLDIGAGTGAWAALLARRARRVTAVEPSAAMIAVMRQELAAASIDNVTIVQGAWPDVEVAPHDVSLCAHAMYGCPDLAGFVRRMVACTRELCFLLLRAPRLDGVRAEAARHVWGHPLDSPNFTIAYNVLLELGIYANVLMEDTGRWRPRTSASLEEALATLKGYLDLAGSDEHDGFLMDLLRRRLEPRDGGYQWPADVTSALVYWRPDPGTAS